MGTSIRDLEPKTLWNNFADLNQIPRGSKKEKRVIEFMKNYGEKLGLETHVDAIGNVVIKKRASPGMENRKTVVLQSHLDMVHQKNSDVDFDFDSEGIRSYVDGDWVKAKGTTLGADNGIGVASIMTLLASKDISHPPLEALFTIDEETGMTGAQNLDERLLDGRILLNLDTEDDDELTIGCAGGIDTYVNLDYEEEPVTDTYQAYRLSVKGLKGGHSGIDINLGRGNANKLMNRLLYKTHAPFGMRISSIDGGSLRNAIPRESIALVVVPADRSDAFQKEFNRRMADIKREYNSIEPGLVFSIETTALSQKVMEAQAQEKVLGALCAVWDGVYRMSPGVPGLVETSSNLARVHVKDGVFSVQGLQRSSIESGKMEVATTVRAAFELIGASVTNEGSYPGWVPNTDSSILRMMEKLYVEQFNEKPKVAACHAGLECGIIGVHYPGMDMISFGPTIKHPHSPDEKVSVKSVGKFWAYLLVILEQTEVEKQ